MIGYIKLNIMKLMNIFRILSAGVVLASLASCHNKEHIFPDYEGGVSAYFAYQYPVRTIVLGESETFDTSLDNEHKCIIYGAMGGAYKGKNVVIDIEVDNSLTDNLYFADGTPVKAMPGHYYDLSSTQLAYGDSHMGGVEVTLRDDFFNDPAAIKNTYVIPVKMTNIVKGADRILTGTPSVEGDTPARTDAAHWKELPKDYTLYCVKYINPWDGSWLRRGVDVITGHGEGKNLRYGHVLTVTDEDADGLEDADGTEVDVTVVNHKSKFYAKDWDKDYISSKIDYANVVENNEVTLLTTNALNSVSFPLTTDVTEVISHTVTSNYALHMTNATKKSANWETQVWYELAEPLKSGKVYEFKCKAAASASTAEGWCSVFLQSADGSKQNYNHGMNFSTDWKEVKMTINPDDDVYVKLTWCIGDKEGTLMLDDVVLTEKGSNVNLILSSDFENQSKDGWSSWDGSESIGPGEGGIKTSTYETTEIYTQTSDLTLTFDDNGNCTVSSATKGITASGTGKFVKDGEKLAWGNKDRDCIYLDYTVDFGQQKYAIKDTLVARSREVALETFAPTYKE